jgi:hypothetical protein
MNAFRFTNDLHLLTVVGVGCLCLASQLDAAEPQPAVGPEQPAFSESFVQSAVPSSNLPLLEERFAAKLQQLDNPEQALDFSAGPPEGLAIRLDPCEQFDASETAWLDKQQVFVYRTVCGATAWFDGFFGDRRYEQASGNTFGRITVGGYWDERNGWNSKVRFRAKFALPSIRRASSLVIGRGDEQDLIEERDTSGSNPAPVSTVSGEDDSTFVGVAFDGARKLGRALSFSAGVKLGNPIDPYAKIRYRRLWQVSDRNMVRFRPIVYWRYEEGLGATMALDFDHVLSNQFLIRWSNFGNISEDETVEGVDWGSTLFLFQAKSIQRAFTYSVFGRGETDAEITFQNAGFEVRYRERIYDDWLFLEFGGGVSWPRYLREEQREANIGAGIKFEGYFGPAPADWMK